MYRREGGFILVVAVVVTFKGSGVKRWGSTHQFCCSTWHWEESGVLDWDLGVCYAGVTGGRKGVKVGLGSLEY